MESTETVGLDALAMRVQVLQAAASEPRALGASRWMLVPEGYKLQEITDAVEKSELVPRRARGAVTLLTLESFIAHCLRLHGVKTTVYADAETSQLTAVFNDTHGTAVGWRDHQALFKPKFTPEYQAWRAQNKQHKSQTEFAEFIEDNVADIIDGDTLLRVATTIQANTSIVFGSSKRLQDGQTQLTYTENVDASAGGGSLTIPKEFRLGLRIYQGDEDGYPFTARLKFRLGQGVKFWYELDRPERVVERAFDDYAAKVAAAGLRVHRGRP